MKWQGRNRIGLKGCRVKGGFARPIPAREKRLAGRERTEGNGVVDEGIVEDDDVGHDFLKDAAGAVTERVQARAVNARDDEAAHGDARAGGWLLRAARDSGSLPATSTSRPRPEASNAVVSIRRFVSRLERIRLDERS